MILPLEKQVCSLKPSKHLAELGVKQESLWCWCRISGKWKLKCIEHPTMDFLGIKEGYSAFTVAELGNLFGQYFDNQDFTEVHSGKCFSSHKDYWCEYQNHEKKDSDYTTYANTEANARAKMLVYLLENKLI